MINAPPVPAWIDIGKERMWDGPRFDYRRKTSRARVYWDYPGGATNKGVVFYYESNVMPARLGSGPARGCWPLPVHAARYSQTAYIPNASSQGNTFPALLR